MYTNADLKISLYVCAHIKKYPENFAVIGPKNSRVTLRSLPPPPLLLGV